MQPFTTHTGIAVPLLKDDINTDQIAPVLFLQLLEGVGCVQLVQHVPVDIDEVAAIGAPPHQVRLPDLVEQGLGHDGFGQWLCAEIVMASSLTRILGGPRVEGKRSRLKCG